MSNDQDVTDLMPHVLQNIIEPIVYIHNITITSSLNLNFYYTQ
jgi:hypothetical protein